MPISTSPPNISILRLNLLPKNTPMRLPITDITKDATPMAASGYANELSVLNPVKANDMPTASASILVATASVRITFSLLGLKLSDSSSLKYSFIILTPRNVRSPNAIQWSVCLYVVMKAFCSQPSKEWHHSLKEAEEEAHFEKCFPLNLM